MLRRYGRQHAHQLSRRAIQSVEQSWAQSKQPINIPENLVLLPRPIQACEGWRTNLNRAPIPDTVYKASRAVNWKKILDTAHYKVLRLKGTEPRGLVVERGGWDDHFDEGEYLCSGCAANGVKTPLYQSYMKFESGSGWPGFWTNVEGNVRVQSNADQVRFEITCSVCDGYLGLVYWNEYLNSLHNQLSNERHCVNSLSLSFLPKGKISLDDRVDTSYTNTIYIPYLKDKVVLGFSAFVVTFFIAFQYYIASIHPAHRISEFEPQGNFVLLEQEQTLDFLDDNEPAS